MVHVSQPPTSKRRKQRINQRGEQWRRAQPGCTAALAKRKTATRASRTTCEQTSHFTTCMSTSHVAAGARECTAAGCVVTSISAPTADPVNISARWSTSYLHRASRVIHRARPGRGSPAFGGRVGSGRAYAQPSAASSASNSSRAMLTLSATSGDTPRPSAATTRRASARATAALYLGWSAVGDAGGRCRGGGSTCSRRRQ